MQATARQAELPESKHDRFIRLGNKRIDNAMYWLQRLALLGSSNYERTPDEVKAIRAALHREVDATCDQLEPRARNGRVEHRLL